MRSEHGRSFAPERFEVEQRVRVDDRREVEPLQELANERLPRGAAPQPRAERERTRAIRCCDDRLDAVGIGPADLDRLENERLDDRKRLGRDGERDVSGVRAEGRTRSERDGAGHSRLPADDEHRARRVLGVARCSARDDVEQGRSGAAVLGVDVIEPDVRQHDAPCAETTGRNGEPDLRRVERDGEVRLDNRTGDLSGRRIDARGEVHGHDGSRGGVDPLDGCRCVGPRLAPKSGPEERIDDHIRSFDLPGLVHRVAGVTQHPRRDTPVPPFDPPPQTHANRRAAGNASIVSRATAVPARSISSGMLSGYPA